MIIQCMSTTTHFLSKHFLRSIILPKDRGVLDVGFMKCKNIQKAEIQKCKYDVTELILVS